VVLIGEMRDLYSAQVAMNLAETGHLVLSTLHSANTLQTLERFISMFPREMHEELYLRLFDVAGGDCLSTISHTS